ncbi:E3 ubiquitin-protein ligase SINA-like 7 [Acyrthosiphon pisum]|uniref:RING-type E3 ubiquitin transferase n=1 Tax=Acyrthosiphon pisum TaxID=7029 RepID=A0A8R2ACY9_ACYPI|nr:E3 ubiquitin-protein ligase SINA-like 7 [Acyrthosiphon pisum]|eukprot:XP_003241456.1 PREDICTED: E3 ubiquitin-protein ligase SINA-like 7 [Acyrthosiphon pisum]
MTSLVVTATTSAEAAESSTASTTETVVAAAASTAEVIEVPRSVVSVASTLPQEPETTEIVAISLKIRRALDCPICLTTMSIMSCFCPNGHAICQSCMLTLLNTSTTHALCPLCRTSMVQSESMSAMVIKLAETTSAVKVACSNWSFGCPDLVPVRYVNEHESVCRYVPDVPCLVHVCQWVGMYEQLYEHVSNMHPGVTVESSTNQLNVTDLHTITRNQRRTYLVRSAYGMMWVLVSRGTRSRIQTGLFMVDSARDGQHLNQHRFNPKPPEFLYRVTWFDGNDRSRTKSRTKQIFWSTALKEIAVFPNAYSMFRFRSGRMEISWFRRYDRNSQVRNHPSQT